MNEGFIDSTLANLKILSMIQKGEKLCIRKGHLTIEKSDKSQFLRRWIHNDNRDTIMLHIRNTIQNAFKIIEHYLNDTSNKKDHNSICNWTLDRIYTEMTLALNGLVNLKTTYINDAIVLANLDVLCDRLNANITNLQNVQDHKSDSTFSANAVIENE